MKKSFLKWSLLLSLLLVSIVQVKAIRLSQTPKPTWIKEVNTPPKDAVDVRDIDAGYFYLLVNNQTSIASKCYFSNYIVAITNEVGVQEASNIEINFDPTFQKLTIHSVSIIRNGNQLNKLNLNEIKLLQREEELNSQIYDGSYTAFINVNDVRVGDLIEYSYSIIGENPIYNNHFYDEFQVTFSTPVAKVFHRLVAESSRKLFYRPHQTSIKPTISSKENSTFYEWEGTCVKPFVFEENTPDWYNPLGWVEVSEYENWQPLVNWALTLYKLQKPLSSELINWTNQLKNERTEAKVLQVLQFVQQEIRYMGFEVGINSYKPRDPSIVFRQRFGDCKDKALLMCTMLKQLGIEAYPNLVHTSKGKIINENLPSPWHFNHVTVCIELNGKKYWFDPTESYQEGNIGQIQYNNSGYTLVVKPGETNLQLIDRLAFAKIDVKETFYILHHDSAVQLSVSTKYYGKEADDMRYRLNSQATSSIEKDYIDYYKRLYGDAEMVGTIEKYDDTVNNIFHTYEKYKLYSMIEEKDRNAKQIELNASQVFNAIHYENSKRRNQPYALRYPIEINQTIQVVFPFQMRISKEANTIKHDCFEYGYSMYNEEENKVVVLNYHYKTLADQVRPDQIRSFVEQSEEIFEANAYFLYWNPSIDSNFATGNSSGGLYESDLISNMFSYALTGVVVFLLLAVYYLSKRING